jgi:hypothetical protein
MNAPGPPRRADHPIPGYEAASPSVRQVLKRLERVRLVEPGRWRATCPCCGEHDGLELVDPDQGVELSQGRR